MIMMVMMMMMIMLIDRLIVFTMLVAMVIGFVRQRFRGQRVLRHLHGWNRRSHAG